MLFAIETIIKWHSGYHIKVMSYYHYCNLNSKKTEFQLEIEYELVIPIEETFLRKLELVSQLCNKNFSIN